MAAMAARVSSPTFIGRQLELNRALAALAAARLGQPNVLLIAGEAGVGKTRFVAEVAGHARRGGDLVLEGGCVQVGTDGLPYGPFIEALRALAHALPSTELDDLLGSGRAELARLMPTLMRAGDDFVQVGMADSTGQGRLFEHVLLLLERLGKRAPFALVIEDIHWADRSTLELLSFLARNLRDVPVLLLATYRSDEPRGGDPLLPFLAEQERAGRATRIELARFDHAELAAQLGAILGVRPDPGLVDRILARSDGNAFYAEELLAGGASDDRLPDTLRAVLLSRVAALSGSTQDILQLAAVGGARISPRLLARVAGTDEQELEASLGEAVAMHVLVPVQAADERYAFRHALVREAVYDDLLAGRRTRLHAAFARALTDDGSPEADASRAAELAYHWQAAGDLPRAFEAWIAAGIAAEAIFAFAEARASFERALDLWDEVPDALERAPLDRVELLTRAAFLAEGPAPTRAVALIRTAIALVDPATDPTRAGLLHERLGQYASTLSDEAAALLAYEEAVRLVPSEPPSAARAWVLAGLGSFLAMADDEAARSVALCEEAISVARAVGAPHIESRALVSLGLDLVLLGDVEEGLATMRRATEIAREIGDVHETARSMGWLTGSLNRQSRYEEAVTAGLEAEAFAVRHGLAARWGTLAVEYMADALISLGRWPEAADALERALRYGPGDVVELELQDALLDLDTLRGHFDAAERRVPHVRVLAQRFFTPFTAVVLAELALWQGDPLAARAAVREGLAGFEAHPQTVARDLSWMFAAGVRAEADIAALARAEGSEAGLREAQEIGAQLLGRMRSIVEDVARRRTYFLPMAAALLASSEAEYTRLQGAPDPDRWAAAASAWEALRIPHDRGYALMREAEATLAGRRDRHRAVSALETAAHIADRPWSHTAPAGSRFDRESGRHRAGECAAGRQDLAPDPPAVGCERRSPEAGTPWSVRADATRTRSPGARRHRSVRCRDRHPALHQQEDCIGARRSNQGQARRAKPSRDRNRRHWHGHHRSPEPTRVSPHRPRDPKHQRLRRYSFAHA